MHDFVHLLFPFHALKTSYQTSSVLKCCCNLPCVFFMDSSTHSFSVVLPWNCFISLTSCRLAYYYMHKAVNSLFSRTFLWHVLFYQFIYRTVSVGSQIYFDNNSSIRTLHASWHPYGDAHLGILSSDSVLRYDGYWSTDVPLISYNSRCNLFFLFFFIIT